MCGRTTREFTWRQIHELLSLTSPPVDISPSYNVAPTQRSSIVRADAGGREMVDARWGLIPFWAKDASIGAKTVNARAETAAGAPAFRTAYASRRCVVPASGFYEWAADPHGGAKQPYYISRADGAPLLFAGLWESWRDPAAPDADALVTYAILTTRANEFMRRMHDRMPVVLEPEVARAWIDSPAPPGAELLAPAADGVLTAHPVSRLVNSPKNNDARLTQMVEPDAGLFS
ncbi:MAG: SOS response-associated peptidase [Planctomycetota bacterium]|nr:SOS response-associated peptidase [Planctomycetota bacterium]